MTERSKRLGLVVGSVALALSMSAVGFELFLRHRYEGWKLDNERRLLSGMLEESPNARLIWENKPAFSGENFKVNRWGFRDVDRDAKEKPEGVYRIAFVGDSVTFGAAVTSDELFVSRIEKAALSVGNRPVQTMNFSVNGYNTLQIEELVRAKALDFSPDRVVYVMCLNDFDFDDASGELIRYFRPPESFVWERLRNVHHTDSTRDYHEEHFARNHDAVFDAIRRMQSTLAARGVAFEVLVLPVFDRQMPSFREYQLTDIHLSISRFLDEAHVRSIDLLPAFRACSKLGPSAYSFDVWHLTPLGHRFVALAASEMLLSEEAPARVSARTCADLEALEPSRARKEGDELEASLSTGAPVRLAIGSSLVQLERFWPIEGEPRGVYAWSRDDNVIGISHLRAGESYEVTLLVADSAGRPQALLGPNHGALQTVALTGSNLHVPAPIVADATGHAAIELRVDTFHPSDTGLADPRELGIALSGIELLRAPLKTDAHDL